MCARAGSAAWASRVSHRLSRDLRGRLNFIAELKKHRALIHFDDIGLYDPNNPKGGFSLDMMLAVKMLLAEEENKKIRQRTRDGLADKVREGKPQGGRRPMGYRFVTKHEANGVTAIVVAPEHAVVVRDIFTWAD